MGDTTLLVFIPVFRPSPPCLCRSWSLFWHAVPPSGASRSRYHQNTAITSNDYVVLAVGVNLMRNVGDRRRIGFSRFRVSAMTTTLNFSIVGKCDAEFPIYQITRTYTTTEIVIVLCAYIKDV